MAEKVRKDMCHWWVKGALGGLRGQQEDKVQLFESAGLLLIGNFGASSFAPRKMETMR